MLQYRSKAVWQQKFSNSRCQLGFKRVSFQWQKKISMDLPIRYTLLLPTALGLQVETGHLDQRSIICSYKRQLKRKIIGPASYIVGPPAARNESVKCDFDPQHYPRYSFIGCRFSKFMAHKECYQWRFHPGFEWNSRFERFFSPGTNFHFSCFKLKTKLEQNPCSMLQIRMNERGSSELDDEGFTLWREGHESWVLFSLSVTYLQKKKGMCLITAYLLWIKLYLVILNFKNYWWWTASMEEVIEYSTHVLHAMYDNYSRLFISCFYTFTSSNQLCPFFSFEKLISNAFWIQRENLFGHCRRVSLA